jgi:hypothetical protein
MDHRHNQDKQDNNPDFEQKPGRNRNNDETARHGHDTSRQGGQDKQRHDEDKRHGGNEHKDK